MGATQVDPGRDPDREARLAALLSAEWEGLRLGQGLPEGVPLELAGELSARGAFVGGRLHCLGRLPRAMEAAKRLVAGLEAQGLDAYSGTALLASELSDGRGRLGRSWFSPPGGIYLALLLSPELPPERMGLYPLAAGVAACRTLRRYLPQARLKWVNDVIIDGRKKVCGLLAESFTSTRHRQDYLLLGVGLNANVAAFPSELDGLATSLELELGRQVDLDQLSAQLLAQLGLHLALLHHHDQQLLEAEHSEALPPNPIVAAFRELTDSFGRRVLYRAGDGDPGTEARAMDVAEDGGLILELEGGGRHTAYGGEIVYLG